MLYKELENIRLNDGKYLSRLYGKYLPNLTIITANAVERYNDLPEDTELSSYFQRFAEGGVTVRKGEYRKNSKGTDIFDFTRSSHILIELHWSGNTNPDLKIPNLNPIYYRCARSNSGRSGVTYYIFPEDIKIEGNLSENDF